MAIPEAQDTKTQSANPSSRILKAIPQPLNHLISTPRPQSSKPRSFQPGNQSPKLESPDTKAQPLAPPEPAPAPAAATTAAAAGTAAAAAGAASSNSSNKTENSDSSRNLKLFRLELKDPSKAHSASENFLAVCHSVFFFGGGAGFGI